MVLVAFELQHDVDHVLEHFGSGKCALFGDVANQGHGHVARLGVAQKFGGGFADLPDASGGGIQLGVVGRLDRVDHEQVGLELLGGLENF